MALAMQQKQFFSTHKPVIPTPKFEVGEEITFTDYEAHISGGGIVTKVVLPGEPGNEYPDSSPFIVPINERPVLNHEILYEIDSIANNIKGKRGWIRESTMKKKLYRATALPVVMATALHPMGYCGIDTCSAVSVSTERADFAYLDESVEAKCSVSLNGVDCRWT
jgi:hypothetical protein